MIGSYLKYPFLVLLLGVSAGSGFSQKAGIENWADSSVVIIDSIIIRGNDVTRERIITRELLFQAEDTIPVRQLQDLLTRSTNNLNNTSLFNFVDIKLQSDTERRPYVDVVIDLVERWYIWPFPIFEIADRNFNAWWEKKDLSRINYGLFVTWNNFRGRMEKLVLYSRFGFDERYYFHYHVPYINKSQTVGLGFSAGFSQNHEVAYNSEDNKEVYYKSETGYPIRQLFAYAELFTRKSIHNTHWFKLSYRQARFSDSLLMLNDDFSFGNRNMNDLFAFYYQFKSDYRDYKHYPLTGYYVDVELDKTGLGLISEGDALSLKTNLRKYSRLGKRFHWASGFTGKISPFWRQPYFYELGLGYGRDFVRGYEYYVIDGQHYALLKNNLKFTLIPTTVKEIGFIPTEKFSKIHFAVYMNLFTDLAWVVDDKDTDLNPLANQLLIGSGVGLDLVAYYDLVFRFELSVNRRWEKGFFIHFMTSI